MTDKREELIERIALSAARRFTRADRDKDVRLTAAYLAARAALEAIPVEPTEAMIEASKALDRAEIVKLKPTDWVEIRLSLADAEKVRSFLSIAASRDTDTGKQE